MAELKPSDWFKEKLQQWQLDLQKWHAKHVEFKDPGKKAVMGTTMSKAAGGAPSPGLSAKAQAKPPGPLTPGLMPGGVVSKAKPGVKEDAEKSKDDEKDEKKPKHDETAEEILQKLEDEALREDTDVFDVEDVCDMQDGKNIPLFSNFAFEDWALLSLRFELHLLCHAVRRDSNGDKKTGIPPEQLASVYAKYFTKSLTPKNYGVETVDGIIELVKDTAITGMRSKVVEPMVTDDLASNDIFIKLTEENRRDRKRKVDAEGESAALKFPRPASPAPAATAVPAMAAMAGTMGKSGGCSPAFIPSLAPLPGLPGLAPLPGLPGLPPVAVGGGAMGGPLGLPPGMGAMAKGKAPGGFSKAFTKSRPPGPDQLNMAGSVATPPVVQLSSPPPFKGPPPSPGVQTVQRPFGMPGGKAIDSSFGMFDSSLGGMPGGKGADKGASAATAKGAGGWQQSGWQQQPSW